MKILVLLWYKYANPESLGETRKCYVCAGYVEGKAQANSRFEGLYKAVNLLVGKSR